ncbi:MAG: META domain-containing protein [Duncaniella sp.]|nr:META domain-containing protein [Duncaniella sp.]MDE6581709.1 META domain-containing protein [Duncaniella sp.]
MNKSSVLIGIMAVMSLGSCSTINNIIHRQDKNAPAPAAPVAPVSETTVVSSNQSVKAISGEWAVIEINGRELNINGDNRPTFTFTAAPDVAGAVSMIAFNGCNYLNGTYLVGEKKLVPQSELISSLMACPDAPYEYEVNQALAKVTEYSVEREGGMSTLKLMDDTGRAVMVLRNHTLSYLNGAWKVLRIDNKTVPASADVKVVIDIQSRTIHGNAGCNLLNGEIILNLDVAAGIEFGNLRTTRMMCPDIETEQAFLVALEQVKAAANVDADHASLLNDKDEVIISLERIDPASME